MTAIWAGWPGMVLAIVAGLCVGSFANVIIYRAPREGLNSLRPARSFCPSCGHRLCWNDNIPVVSWIVLRRRCRTCAVPIHWKYPLVEMLVAALFAATWWRLSAAGGIPVARLAVCWYLAATCVVVTFIDLEHRIIPDTITLPGIALGLVASACLPWIHAGQHGYLEAEPHVSGLLLGAGGMLAGGGLLWVVGQAGNVVLRRKLQASGVPDAMGYGDVKWMGLAGTFLGPLGALDGILFGCFSGAAVGLCLQLVARMRRRPVPVGIPFGPFLSLGILAELMRPGLAWSVLSGLAGAP